MHLSRKGRPRRRPPLSLQDRAFLLINESVPLKRAEGGAREVTKKAEPHGPSQPWGPRFKRALESAKKDNGKMRQRHLRAQANRIDHQRTGKPEVYGKEKKTAAVSTTGSEGLVHHTHLGTCPAQVPGMRSRHQGEGIRPRRRVRSYARSPQRRGSTAPEHPRCTAALGTCSRIPGSRRSSLPVCNLHPGESRSLWGPPLQASATEAARIEPRVPINLPSNRGPS